MDMIMRGAVRPDASSLGPMFEASMTSPRSARPTEDSASLYVDKRELRIHQAESIIMVHVPSTDGWCVGCEDLGRYALAPCPASRLALSIVETHGVAVWDARPSGCTESLSLSRRSARETPSSVWTVV